MAVLELLREIEGRGVELMAAPVEPRLRFRPASALTPDLIEGLRQHKAEILERLEASEEPTQNFAEVSAREEPSQKFGQVSEPIIQDTAEVLELAHAYFGEMEHPEEPPYPPHEGSGDPMVRTHTPKAQFFQGIRRRDRERREREGLPPWIRVVDGGAA